MGSKDSKEVVPTQFAHNLSLSYSLQQGRYNFSIECRNLTDEKLYDNFSLQKAGRAYYAKVRVLLGSKANATGRSNRRGGHGGSGRRH